MYDSAKKIAKSARPELSTGSRLKASKNRAVLEIAKSARPELVEGFEWSKIKIKIFIKILKGKI